MSLNLTISGMIGVDRQAIISLLVLVGVGSRCMPNHHDFRSGPFPCASFRIPLNRQFNIVFKHIK